MLGGSGWAQRLQWRRQLSWGGRPSAHARGGDRKVCSCWKPPSGLCVGLQSVLSMELTSPGASGEKAPALPVLPSRGLPLPPQQVEEVISLVHTQGQKNGGFTPEEGSVKELVDIFSNCQYVFSVPKIKSRRHFRIYSKIQKLKR